MEIDFSVEIEGNWENELKKFDQLSNEELIHYSTFVLSNQRLFALYPMILIKYSCFQKNDWPFEELLLLFKYKNR